MKKIWKVWTVILVVAATVLLTISTQYSKKEEISTDSYQYLIGVSLPNVIEPWLNNFVDVFTEKVSQDKKINVIFRDAAGNPEKQIQDIETLMEYGIDILIVSPDGSDSLSSVLSEAFQKIPVILTGVGAGTEDYTCLIMDFNVISRNALLEAQKNPETHKNIVVRVCGYSAYFHTLTAEMQNEVIQRTQR